MIGIKIDILKLLSPSQPGWVECSFVDANGTAHLFEEKIPVVTTEHLDENSKYPASGIIAGEIIKEAINETGQAIVTVDFVRPWGVDVQGSYVFEIHKNDIIEF